MRKTYQAIAQYDPTLNLPRTVRSRIVAQTLEFRDPITNEHRHFHSGATLQAWTACQEWSGPDHHRRPGAGG